LIPVLALGTTEAAIALAVPSARAGALAQPKATAETSAVARTRILSMLFSQAVGGS
jgi:hypothetical protein